jgi:acetyltransferase-like isoleucine patch superfamily enzyme
MAYKGDISIGEHVAIAPGCAFYSYNHGTDPDELIKRQPIETKGGIKIGDGVWLGFGVIVLDGVSIGSGAIVGAGSVVTEDIPEKAIAVGNPARVILHRGQTN